MSTVNVQTVVKILSEKVAALTTENAILQAQNAELGELVRKLEGQAGELVNKEKSAVQPAE